MLLADYEIKHALDAGTLKVHPFDDGMLQPTSVDLQLGHEVRLYTPSDEPIDPYNIPDNATVLEKLTAGEPFLLEPGVFILAETLQYVSLSESYAARIEGKSTIARLGLTVHATAGFVDPGFRGTLTLEITNDNDKRGIYLFPGMLIAQLSITKVQSVARPYGSAMLDSHYQNQSGARPPASLRKTVAGGFHSY